MRKVLFFIETLGGGGAEKVLCDLVNHMDQSKFDITVPQAEWSYNGVWRPIRMIHWGNFGTMKAFYLFEACAARRKLRGKPAKGLAWTLLYRWKLLYCVLHVCDLVTLGKRVWRRIKKRMRNRRR